MFSLDQQTAKLTNVNPRNELHGEEHHLARLIALDLAALIADEGEFNPKEWGR